MKTVRMKFVLLAIVVAGCLVSLVQIGGGQPMSAEQKVQGEIDREKAIQVAMDHASNAQVDTSLYSATACEVRSLWRVYLEPAVAGEVLEYAVTKTGGGVVLTSTKWSGMTKSSQPGRAGSLPASIGQVEAVAVAQKDAQRVSDLSKKEMTVCELRSFWRIIYSPPVQLDGGGPEYLIDKRTGMITDKKYYQ